MKQKKVGNQQDRDLRDDPERRKAYRRKKKAVDDAFEKKIKNSEYNEMVQYRAFEIYQDRVTGNKPGDDLQDWFQAEKELSHSNVSG